MSTQVQQLRGTTAENNAFTGKAGVITVDTEKNDLRIHDGTTRGGVSILEKATDLQRNGGVINGDVTINDAIGSSYAILPNPSGRGNPTIRLGYTKESENFCDLAFVGRSFNIYLRKFGDVARFFDDGTTRFSNTVGVGDSWWQSDGNMGGSCWSGGNLYTHIENRINTCVTNSRIAGAVMLRTSTDVKAEMPSGYFVTTGYWIEGQLCMSGRQPQLYIKDIGWFPLGAW